MAGIKVLFAIYHPGQDRYHIIRFIYFDFGRKTLTYLILYF